MPALHELARAAMRLMFSGDASQWDRALQMPHYNTRSMPAISMHTGMHLIQARPCAVCVRVSVFQDSGVDITCAPCPPSLCTPACTSSRRARPTISMGDEIAEFESLGYVNAACVYDRRDANEAKREF